MRVVTRPDGGRFAEECECQHTRKIAKSLERCRIPPKYINKDLDTFLTDFPGADASLRNAHFLATRFVDNYPAMMAPGRGFLFAGSSGLGKTHLAVGILKVLVLEKGCDGIFCYHQQLLKDIQNSYSPLTGTTELEILDPVFKTELLVLDDLGSVKPSDWVWDTVSLVLNTRYNNQLTTIVTTNFPNLPAKSLSPNAKDYSREDSLGDRIGDRMRSRLLEMCREVKMQGADYRETLGRDDSLSPKAILPGRG